MNERLKFILFVVFSLIVFWFTLILLCLPPGEPWPPVAITKAADDESNHHHLPHHNRDHGYPPHKVRRAEPRSPRTRWNQSPPHPYPDIMQLFQTKPLSLVDTIFYQFDPLQAAANLTTTSATPGQLIVSEKGHKEATLALDSLKGPTDHYVKSRGDKLFSFNLLASNRVGLLRPLPDTRQAKCPRNLASPTTLTSSIVICYYNEAPSALLRTIHSILARTDPSALREILIVDDHSEPGYDMDQIQPHLAASLRGCHSEQLVKFVRTPKREGLIRARLFGADLAQGEVLIFLDSHVEPNVGWLEPLMAVISENKSTIACPMIDLINAETMLYTASPMVKGGLTWALHFKWISVPANTLKTYDDFVKPIRSPSMAGGLYAIRRDYFFELGAYDRGMNLWGGENIDLSLRAWMCGGQVLILPCSRVGHIFRKTRPYGPAAGEPDSLTYNSHRVARVWLDEHIEKYYTIVPHTRQLDSGDISERQALRRQLKCHNFTWYMENVYPDLKQEGQELLSKAAAAPADEKKPEDLFATSSRRINRRAVSQRRFERAHAAQLISVSSGRPVVVVAKYQIQLSDSDLCLEPKMSLMASRLKFSRLVLEDCATNLSSLSAGGHQLWTETDAHEIRMGDGADYCLDIMKNLPLLRKCHNMGSYQAWSHSNHSSASSTTTHIMSQFSSGNLCLAVERVQRGEPAIITICDKKPDDSSHNSLPQAVGTATAEGRQHQHYAARDRQRRRRRHKDHHADDDQSSWLTGSLPASMQQPSGARRRKSVGNRSLVVRQRWKLNVVPIAGRDPPTKLPP